MKQYIALSLLVGACAVALFSLFGDDSYSRMQSLKRNIESQQDKNSELEARVSKLQSEIASLRFDDKQLETKARNELGMARPNELIFRFDSSLEEETKKLEAQRAEQAKSRSEINHNASVLRPQNGSVNGGRLDSSNKLSSSGRSEQGRTSLKVP